MYPVLLVRTYWSSGKLNNLLLRVLLIHMRFICRRLMCLRPLAVADFSDCTKRRLLQISSVTDLRECRRFVVRVLPLSGSFWMFTWLHRSRKHQDRNCLPRSGSSGTFPQLITAVPHSTLTSRKVLIDYAISVTAVIAYS